MKWRLTLKSFVEEFGKKDKNKGTGKEGATNEVVHEDEFLAEDTLGGISW